MRRPHIVPTGFERTFRDDELIVSKTDPTGRITYANDLFVRLAGYTRAELMGAPHSIVRHPDMPRGIFKFLWDTLASGNEVFAIVKNLSRNGDHYWVLAHVSPTFAADGTTILGHHSNRRTAERASIAVLEPIYARMREEEERHGKADGADASLPILMAELTARNTTYASLMFGKEKAA
jgi:PAS domain S-box-containing protein